MEPEYIQSNAILIVILGLALQVSSLQASVLQTSLNLGNTGLLLIGLALVTGLTSINYY